VYFGASLDLCGSLHDAPSLVVVTVPCNAYSVEIERAVNDLPPA
jgi:hypothetical protein